MDSVALRAITDIAGTAGVTDIFPVMPGMVLSSARVPHGSSIRARRASQGCPALVHAWENRIAVCPRGTVIHQADDVFVSRVVSHCSLFSQVNTTQLLTSKRPTGVHVVDVRAAQDHVVAQSEPMLVPRQR